MHGRASGRSHWGDALSLAGKAFRPDRAPGRGNTKDARMVFSERCRWPHPLAKGRNLIMVQCESLQYFVIGLRLNGVEVAPNLNRFARECVYFRNTWNQIAGGLSSDSEFMANTGMFPAPSGAAYTRIGQQRLQLPAVELEGEGLSYCRFPGDTRPFLEFPHHANHRLGFQKDYSRSTFPNGEIIGLGLSHSHLRRRSRPWRSWKNRFLPLWSR